MIDCQQAAQILGVSSRKMYELAAPSGPVKCYRIGRSVRFEQADIEEYKVQCQSTETRNAVVSSLSSTAVSVASESELESFFRKRGIAPRRTPSTALSALSAPVWSISSPPQAGRKKARQHRSADGLKRLALIAPPGEETTVATVDRCAYSAGVASVAAGAAAGAGMMIGTAGLYVWIAWPARS